MSEPERENTEQPAPNSSQPDGAQQAASSPGYRGEFFVETPPPAPLKARARSPKQSLPLVWIGAALLVSLLGALVAFHHSSLTPAPDSQDLGDGVFKPAGLRGHMQVRWDGKLHYQVQIQPIDATMESGFTYVLSNPPRPLELTIHLVDSSGFNLCQKDILIPWDPARSLPDLSAEPPTRGGKAALMRWQQESAMRQAQLTSLEVQEQARERGQDLFQPQLDPDGNIIALNAQGEVPCSRQTFKHVDFWEISTNFPTLEEQQALMNRQHQKIDELAQRAQRQARQKFTKRFASAFYVQGDEHITGYDPSNGTLITGPGTTFIVTHPSDWPLAAQWAASSALIHYKCGQQAVCVLTHSGSTSAIYAKMNE